jgi:4-hydroxy-tetrahydrodipicolinate synthase
MREMWESAQRGDLARAREIDQALQPLYAALGVTTNPIPIKAALELAGVIPSGRLRLPLVPADREQRDVIAAALQKVGI